MLAYLHLSFMRSGLLLLVLLFVGASGCEQPSSTQTSGSQDSSRYLISRFADPPSEFGPAPLYVWNGIMTREGISRDMTAFKDAGFGGVFVHPRPGLITEYLSDTWFDLFRHTVDLGRQLDMKVWIYDENSYPSGFGGGHVPAEMPESYNQGQGLVPTEVSQVPSDYSDVFIVLKQTDEGYEDVTNTIDQEIGKVGDYVLFRKSFFETSEWFGGWSYVDLLVPGVTEKFLDVTMTGYEAAAGEEFGNIVPGVFTDEPEINSPDGLKWTPDLFKVFSGQWGYDLLPNLPSLFKETGNWKQVRHNYTQTLLWLFIERFSKPEFAYMEEKGLAFTGHYWEHGWPSMRLGGDNMAMYAYHQMPGIDMLFNQFDEVSAGAQFGNIRSVKELASVANQLGQRRTLSETYGGGGWELTFEDMKRLGDWEYALGVNFMNQHLSHSTLAGARKYDYPPSFMPHSPWWDNYRHLNDYFTRLSLALSSGQQKNDILIIEPTTTAWLYDSYVRDLRNAKMDSIGASFQRFVTELEKSQVEYDLGSEDIIANHGSVDGIRFVVGNRAYTKVILPPLTENINRKTFQLLQTYVSLGGQLYTFAAPTLVNGSPEPKLETFLTLYPASIHQYPGLTRELIDEDFAPSGIDIQLLRGGNLFHHRRQFEDGQLLFLANASLDEATRIDLSADGADAIQFDLFTGEISDFPEEIEDKAVGLKIDLDPAESVLLFIANEAVEGLAPANVPASSTSIQPSSATTVSMDHENVLSIDFLDVKIGNTTTAGLNVYDANRQVYEAFGFDDGNPWNHSVQYKTSVLDRGVFEEDSGFDATYRFSVADNFDLSALTAVVERPELWSVSVNGTTVEPTPDTWWLDRSFGEYAIGDLVQIGDNDLTIHCQPMKIHAEIEPVYLVGNFGLESADKGWTMVSPGEELSLGSWKEQGLPFYSWGATYSTSFEIDNPASGRFSVEVLDWTGTAVDVSVNGKAAGTMALHSDVLDVTGYVKDGSNTVDVKVIGSLKNLMGPHHKDPAPGMAGPWHWREVGAYPPGNEYHQLDYGLWGEVRMTAER